MSIRDPEVLEALRDQPELLAIADAVEDTQRPGPSPRRRALLTRSAVVVAVGAAALIAVLLWPSGGNRNPVLDRALAAIGDGPVLHLVTEAPSATQPELVNLQTGRTTVPKFVFETWTERRMKRLHTLMREDGRVVGEILFPQDRTPDMHIGPVDPAFAAIWTGYRDALATGKAKLVGEGTLYGHQVYFLQFRSPFHDSPGDEVAVDQSTYEPVAFRSIFAGRHFDTRVLLFRMEPFSSTDFQRRTSLRSLAGVSVGGGGMQVAPVRPGESAKPWLSAGSSIAGLKQTGVHQTQTTSARGTANGFHIVYGAESRPRKSVTVDEVKRAADPSEWKGIPEGSMRLVPAEASDGNGSPYDIWTGYLVRSGVYVTIETGVSRAAALEAARALRPA
jgi:hypothetical protein